MRMINTTLAGVTITLGLMASAVMAQEFNLAFTPPLDSHYGDGGKAFAARMDELSSGSITINLKPAGALGGERDVIEGLQIGTVDLAISSTGPIGNFVPDIYALDFPFLFKSYDAAHTVLDGPIGQGLLDEFQAHELVGLAWGENGFRNVTNNIHPINTPEDLAGLKLRTMENKVHIAAFEAAGAAPTPMSWTEVLTSLAQGTIDGQENPIPVLVANNMWEIQKYVTLTQHVYSPAVVVMSKARFDGLSEEQQGWFVEAGKAAAAATRATVASNEANGVALLRENGMDVIDSVDKAAFATAVLPAYDQYAEEMGVADLIQQIQNAQN